MNMTRGNLIRVIIFCMALFGSYAIVNSMDPGVVRVSDEAAGPNSGRTAAANVVPGQPGPNNGFAPDEYAPLPPSNPVPRSRRRDIGPRYELDHRIGDRFGVNNGDTGLNLFLPFQWGSSDKLFFLDARALVTDMGRTGANLGGGYRTYSPALNRIFGLSAWYDYDDGTANSYQQVGFSFESLGRWMDLRINGYLPFGTDSNLLSTSYSGSPFYGGFDLLIQRNRVIQSAFAGVDAEVGGPLPLLGRYGTSGYVGGYYRQAQDDQQAAGVKVRIQSNVTQDAQVNLNVSNDALFGTNVWVNMALTLPDGRARKWFRPRRVQDRLLRRVQRDRRIITHRRTAIDNYALLNASGANAGQSIRVIHVNPAAAANGDGSFVSPLNSFDAFTNTPDTDLILVQGGDLTGNVTLFDNQRLLSAAIINQQSPTFASNLGTFDIPVVNASATVPIFSSATGGNLVSITGDQTEVAGFIFDGATTGGAPNSTPILGANIAGFNIHNNTFRDYTDGVVLINATGTEAAGTPGLFHSNILIGTPGTSIDGFRLTNTGTGNLDLEIAASPIAGSIGNIATGNDNFAFNVTARDRAEINATIVGNIAASEDTNRNGLFDTEDVNANGVLDPSEDLNGNGVLDTGEDLNANGTLDLAEDTNGNGVIDTEDRNGNNRLDLGNGNGLALIAGATRSTISGRIMNNTFSDNRGEDLNLNGILEASEDRDADLTLDRGTGIFLSANSSTIDFQQIGEDVNGNGILDGVEDVNRNGVLDPGEDLNANNRLDYGEDANEDVNGNGILDAGEDRNGDGFLNLGNQNGLLNGGRLIANNTILANTGTGILVESTNNSNVLMRLTGNTIGDPDNVLNLSGRGLSVSADSGTVVADLGFLRNEDVNFNGVFDTEDLNGNGTLDFGEDANNNGTLDTEDTNGNLALDAANPANANSFVNNAGGGIDFNLTGTAVGTINSLNNTISFPVIRTGMNASSLLASADSSAGPADLGFLANFFGTAFTGVFVNDNGNLTFNSEFMGVPATATPITNLATDATTAGLITNPILAAFLADADTTQGNPVTFGQGLIGGRNAFAANFVAVRHQDAAPTVTTPTVVPDNNGEPTNSFQIVLIDRSDVSPGDFDIEYNYDNIVWEAGELNSGGDSAGLGGSSAAVGYYDGANAGNSFTLPGSGVNGALLNGGPLATSLVRNNLNSARSGRYVFQARNGTVISTSVGTTATAADGVRISLADDAVLQASTFFNTNVSGASGNGMHVEASNAATIQNLIVRNSDFSSNGVLNSGSGLSFNTFNSTGSGASITAELIDNTYIGNAGNGLSATADGGTITLTEVDPSTFSGNAGDGIALATSINGRVNARIRDNTIDNNTGNGLSATADGGTITLNQLTNNTITNNRGDGLRFETSAGGSIIIATSEDTNNNGILDAGEDGNGNGLLDVGMTGNTVDNNAGIAMFITGNTGSFNLGTVANNSFLRTTTGSGGIIIDVADTIVTGSFIGNTIIGQLSEDLDGDGMLDVAGVEDTNMNGILDVYGAGFLMTADGGLFDVGIGGPGLTDGNIFRQNVGTGVGFVLQSTAIGQFRVQNNVIQSTTDDNLLGTPLAAEGIYVSLESGASAPASSAILGQSLIDGNLIGDLTDATLGNGGAGILFNAAGNSAVQDLTVSNNTIANNGAVSLGLGGVVFNRIENASLDIVNPIAGQTRAVTLADNVITLNAGDGVRITAQDADSGDNDFELRNNEITNHTGNGIFLRSQGDAFLLTDIIDNTIDTNMGHGIQLEGIEVSTNDMESQAGTWIKNTITNNTLDGINIDAVMGTTMGGNPISLVIGQTGIDPSDNESRGNLIDSNGGNGITVTRSGSLEINNNIISNNVTGVDIELMATGVSVGDSMANNIAMLNVEMIGNSIKFNSGDGLELLSSGSITSSALPADNLASSVLTLNALGNTISENALRGIDILNRGDGQSIIHIGDGTAGGRNFIVSNALQGIYAVNTASTTQNQTDPATTALAADGALASTPNLELRVNNNTIDSNNTSGTFSGGGLVLRVGSTQSGVFAGEAGVLVDMINTTGVSGVRAEVVNNTFQGNGGDDVYIDSFTSTVNPQTSSVTVFEDDPLARLDMVFRGNTGDSINVTNVGAFYNNSDAIKSPPTLVATRRRNAQRLPVGMTSGTGTSTFRVESNFEDTEDNMPANGTFDPGEDRNMNGMLDRYFMTVNLGFDDSISFPGAITGELPFRWDTSLTPGTVFP